MGKRAGTQESIARQIQKVNMNLDKVDYTMDIRDMHLDLLCLGGPAVWWAKARGEP
jgi:hypothetical protein